MQSQSTRLGKGSRHNCRWRLGGHYDNRQGATCRVQRPVVGAATPLQRDQFSRTLGFRESATQGHGGSATPPVSCWITLRV
jgi:hypothetical protein